jgi:hypothetical protein
LYFLFSAAVLFGLQVDKAELDKGQGSEINFVNYVGPHTKIDTLQQIIGIGSSLGAKITDRYGESSYYGVYRVIHAVGPAEGDLLDADVFIFEKSAAVDEIINVMRILSGYLQAAYAYSADDAMLLAKFIVYYNAAFRGDVKYFSSVYKSTVMKNVTAENAGIARVYSEWPGRTRMLIPLSNGLGKGSLSALSTEQLTAPKVIENLQSQPGKGIPERQGIAELQQRQVEQGQQEVAQAQSQIAQDQRKLTADQNALTQMRTQAEQAQAAAAAPGATQGQKTAAAAQAAAVSQQEQKVQAEQSQIQQQQQAVAAQQQQNARKEQNVQAARASIAADEQALIKQKEQAQPAPQSQPQAAPTPQPAAPQSQPAASAPVVQPAPSTTVLFYYDTGSSTERLGRLVLIDGVTGKLLSQSDLNSVRGRNFISFQGRLLVVAGRTDGTAAVRLVSVDPKSLAVAAQGQDNLIADSYLAASKDSLYAVLDTSAGAFLGRFDKDLKLKAQSESPIDPYTFIALSQTDVYAQDAAGNILILGMTDLKQK